MMFNRLQPYMVSISEYAQTIADEELLSFVYPSRFVNVKLFNRKEVDYEHFKNRRLISVKSSIGQGRLIYHLHSSLNQVSPASYLLCTSAMADGLISSFPSEDISGYHRFFNATKSNDTLESYLRCNFRNDLQVL